MKQKRKIILTILLACVLFVLFYGRNAENLQIYDLRQDIIIYKGANSYHNFGVMSTEGEVYYAPKYSDFYFLKDYILLEEYMGNRTYNLTIIDPKNPKQRVKQYDQVTRIRHFLDDSYVYWLEDQDKTLLISFEGDFIELEGFFEIPDKIDTDHLFFTFDQHGIAIIKNGELFGTINRQGQLIIEPMYTFLSTFNDDGIAIACNENYLCGAITTTKDLVIPMNDSKENIQQKIIELYPKPEIIKEGDYFGVVDPDGGTILPFIYDQIYDPYKNSKLYQVRISEKVGLMNSQGEPLLPLEYDSFYYTEHNFNYLIFAQKGELKQLYTYNPKTAQLIQHHDDSYAFDYSIYRGSFWVEKADSFSICSRDGEILYPIVFDHISTNNGLYFIGGINQNYYYLDSPDRRPHFSSSSEDISFITSDLSTTIRMKKGHIYRGTLEGDEEILYNKYFALTKENGQNLIQSFQYSSILAIMTIYIIIPYFKGLFKVSEDDEVNDIQHHQP